MGQDSHRKVRRLSDITYMEPRAISVARRLVPRLWLFVWIGLLLLVPGLLIPIPTISLGFTISSTTVFAVALLAIGANRRYLASTRHFHESLDVFVHNDSSPTLFATEDGEITYANTAVRKRFGQVEGKSLVMVLASYCANPVNVIFRIQNKARAACAAREDLVSETGHMRLSAHHIGPQGFIWRLEDLVERRESGNDVAEPIAMPMLLSSDGGQVLHMNRALRALVGGGISHLDRLFHDLPLRQNGLHQIITKTGPQVVRVVDHRRDTGRHEVFLIPTSPQEANANPTRRLFDNLPVALLKLSSGGVVLAANRLARKLLGQPVIGETFLGDLVEGLGRPIGDWLRDAADGKGRLHPEIVQSCDKKTELFLKIALTRVVENGETGLIAVLNDATELKTLEAQFVQSQKMQAIGQLAGGVAHDFNNLLTAISGYCDLLLLRHDEGDPDFGDLIQINQNANRAASLVSQLLAFSRKQNLQPELLDLRDTLSDLSHLLNRLLGEKVTLKVASANDLLPVRADKRQLEQVLMNLVVNARDSMPTGGEVTLDTQNLTLKSELRRDRAVVAPGKYVSIRVSDHGSGIAPDKISKIFEPFYTTKKTGEGTGLGLSMVYGIVKQTGGFIFVDSAPGQGSAFQILLPACEEAIDNTYLRARTPSRPATARENGVILLVEDEAPVRGFAARALRICGYTVLEAGNADEALTLLEDSSLMVDVFVTDVIMPGKDGPTWVREALIDRPGVKVIFVSGYAEESFSQQQAEIANSSFLPKPFSLSDLTEKVRAQIAG